MKTAPVAVALTCLAILLCGGIAAGFWWGSSRRESVEVVREIVREVPVEGEKEVEIVKTPKKGRWGKRRWVWRKYSWHLDDLHGDPPCIISQRSQLDGRWDDVITVHGFVDDNEVAEKIIKALTPLRKYRIREMMWTD